MNTLQLFHIPIIVEVCRTGVVDTCRCCGVEEGTGVVEGTGVEEGTGTRTVLLVSGRLAHVAFFTVCIIAPPAHVN